MRHDPADEAALDMDAIGAYLARFRLGPDALFRAERRLEYLDVDEDKIDPDLHGPFTETPPSGSIGWMWGECDLLLHVYADEICSEDPEVFKRALGGCVFAGNAILARDRYAIQQAAQHWALGLAFGRGDDGSCYWHVIAQDLERFVDPADAQPVDMRDGPTAVALFVRLHWSVDWRPGWWPEHHARFPRRLRDVAVAVLHAVYRAAPRAPARLVDLLVQRAVDASLAADPEPGAPAAE